ncbi:hypothetical protein DIURU_004297 [Diutina rugosa]|uniref:alcohol dehydrogenase n=1 Tax=Diutina rugosa TaxID=5481 RepID=A0A642UI49_DIURU|nr:uncharacterized protein DIURU_004297 [Diutina rugosa]KAA8899455.1 hypothetical protein DIURU_004297 [Diutina rugosa]
MSIPKTQTAAIFHTPGKDLHLDTIAVPTPQPNELLVKLKYSGVCHTDLHVYHNDFPIELKLEPCLVGGHEGVGEVVAMGSAVTGWELGDLAGIKWLYSSCQRCECCIKGDESSCPHAVLSGATHDGSFQQYATADFIQAARIPKGTDEAAVAPILCAGVTVYKALKTANLVPGNWVAISGAGGGLGSLAVQYAKAMGLRPLAIDGGDAKGALVKKLGAEVYLDFTKEKDMVQAVIDATGGGAHGAINVSISPQAMNQSVEYLRSNGTSVLVGLPKGAEVTVPVFSAVARSVSVRGSYVGNRQDTAEAIDFFARGLITCPIEVVPLGQLSHVYDRLAKGDVVGRVVVDLEKVE